MNITWRWAINVIASLSLPAAVELHVQNVPPETIISMVMPTEQHETWILKPNVGHNHCLKVCDCFSMLRTVELTEELVVSITYFTVCWCFVTALKGSDYRNMYAQLPWQRIWYALQSWLRVVEILLPVLRDQVMWLTEKLVCTARLNLVSVFVLHNLSV